MVPSAQGSVSVRGVIDLYIVKKLKLFQFQVIKRVKCKLYSWCRFYERQRYKNRLDLEISQKQTKMFPL